MTNGLAASTFGEKNRSRLGEISTGQRKRRIELGTVEETVGKLTLKMVAAGHWC
jgi:hypothetical protein